MGTVFVARRDDDVHHHPVAVKLMQMGLESEEMLRRFRREREILAGLQHPNIARLLDGGTADDGRPYLVMELVDSGVPIDQFCQEQELDIPQRLRIFQKVCAAVHFAHQQLVVHRDLKPGNILVTPEGDPKLLDFGIAKLLSTQDFPVTVVTTMPGHSPMTPSWASPEQMRGERIATSSDIYALGILLYRLLCGAHPYQLDGCTYAEAIRIVCEEEPQPPSTRLLQGDASQEERQRSRQVAGDLDDIVLKALRKDPRQRYSSAEQLAQDIERHLTGLPVEARKGTFSYRAGKFVRRHRVGVASAATALVLLLVFIGALLFQQQQVIAQRDRFENIAEFLIDVFENPNPKGSADPNLTARELLERGAADLEARLQDQPAARADMHAVIGLSFHGLGRHDESMEQLRASLELRQSLLEPDHPKIAESLQRMAQVASDQGDYAQAEDFCRRALEIRRRVHRPPHADLADSQYRLAWILERQGDYDTAGVHYRQALDAARQLDEPELLASILTSYGILRRLTADYDTSQTLLDEALVLRRELFGEHHALTVDTRNSLGLLYDAQGRFDEAEASFNLALDAARQIYEGPHNTVASILGNLAKVLTEKGRFDEAEAVYLEALDLEKTFYGGPHPHIATHLGRLAFLYRRMERHEEAAQSARQALEMRRRLFGDSHKDVALSCDYLATSLIRLERYDEAEALFEEAIAIYRRTVGEDHPQLAKSLNNYASLLFELERKGEAKELFGQSLQILRTVHGDDHPEVGNLSFNLGYMHHQAGELEQAASHYQTAVRIARGSLGDDHPNVGIMLTQQARLANDRGLFGEAEQMIRQALTILEASFDWEHTRRLRAELVIAESLLSSGQPEEAEDVLQRRYDWVREHKTADDNNRRNVEALMERIRQ